MPSASVFVLCFNGAAIRSLIATDVLADCQTPEEASFPLLLFLINIGWLGQLYQF